MKKIQLGNSDMEITPIGFGAWAIGGIWEWGWGSQDDEVSIKTIHKALEMGINWIDTAAIYGLGHSEEVVGKAIKQSGYSPYVFTKCSLVWDDKMAVSNSLKEESIRREVENSLRRLDIDVIDLYQIHWPIPHSDLKEGWHTLAKLKEEGKVRYIGLSNFNSIKMAGMRKITDITSLQPPYSLIHREIEEKELPFCKEHKVGVICYSPMASGMLTGKMTRERIQNLETSDWRHKSDDFKEPNLSKNLAIQDNCIEIGKKYDKTAAEIAIAWVLKNPVVTGAIVGMRSPEQVEGVIHAPEVTLSDEDCEYLENTGL